ncbi:MAG: helix-turn-helix domain-containing protein [Eubacteriales bacterium]
MEISHVERFKIISENIKKYRKQKDMTQIQLAEKVGISLSYLTKIEAANCDKSFSLDVLFDIANALETDIKLFFEL